LGPPRLHQHAEVQLPPARHGERLGVVRLLHPQRHVALELPKQPLPQLPAGHELPFPPGERRVVHLDVHRDRRLLDRDPREPLEAAGRRHGLADLHPGEPRERHDLARLRFLELHPVQPLEAEELHHSSLLVRPPPPPPRQPGPVTVLPISPPASPPSPPISPASASSSSTRSNPSKPKSFTPRACSYAPAPAPPPAPAPAAPGPAPSPTGPGSPSGKS